MAEGEPLISGISVKKQGWGVLEPSAGGFAAGRVKARVWVRLEGDLRRSAPLLVVLLWRLRFWLESLCSTPWPLPALGALSLLVPRCCSTSVTHWAHIWHITHSPACPQRRGCAGPGWAGRGRRWHGDTHPLPALTSQGSCSCPASSRLPRE